MEKLPKSSAIPEALFAAAGGTAGTFLVIIATRAAYAHGIFAATLTFVVTVVLAFLLMAVSSVIGGHFRI